MILDITDTKLFNSLFNFNYGGYIFIQLTKNKKSYTVSTCGFNIDSKAQLHLSKNEKIRYTYKDLQYAILVFSSLVKNVCENFEFFSNTYFKSKDLMNYVHKQ